MVNSSNGWAIFRGIKKGENQGNNKYVDDIGSRIFIFSFAAFLKDIFGSGIFDDAIPSLNLFFAGYIFKAGILLFCFILYGLGDTIRPMFFMLISFGVKLLTSSFFLFTVSHSIEGIGWAELISNIIVFAAIGIYLYKTHPIFQQLITKFELTAKSFFIHLRIALPLMIQGIALTLGSIFFASISFQLIGPDEAGRQVIAKTFMLFPTTLINAMVMALAIFSAHNSSAGRNDRTIIALAVLILSTGIAIFTYGYSILFSRFLLNLFIDNPLSFSAAKSELLFLSFTLIMVATNQCLMAVFKGNGDTIVSLFISLVALLVIQTPILYFTNEIIQEKSIWLAKLAGFCITFLISIIYFATGWWKKWTLVNHR